MGNRYLEKVAGWRQKFEQTSAGKKLGLSGASNQSVLASLGGSGTQHTIATGSKAPVMQKGLLGLGKAKQVGMAPDGVTRKTGDVLAKGNLQNRLGKFKADKAAAAAQASAQAPKAGLLNRAIGLAKARPKLAIGAGVGALGLGALALRKGSQSAQPQYSAPQYY